MKKLILSIDCGTQSLRTLLFAETGELLHKVQIHYDPYQSPKPGWAEQHPEIFWESLKTACATLKREYPAEFDLVAGIGVTTMRNTMVNLDRNGKPLRPIITWLDQRKADDIIGRHLLWRMGLRCIGMESALRTLQRDGKCNWIRQNEPDVWEKTHKYLQVSGFLNYRLTGKFTDSVASQIGHLPFNYRKMKWAGKLSSPYLMFPIDRDKLPDLVPPGAAIGRITAEAARETGIAQGTPVIACGSDKGCETIGMGVLDEMTASLSFGTTATVQISTKRYYKPIRFMPPYPAPIPGYYNPEIEIFRGYWMITWFKDEFAHEEVQAAKQNGTVPEKELDKLLKQSPPGAMGLIVQPYWGPGLKQPTAKGAMIGFGDVHKKAHVYRAVIEGLGYALLDGLHTIEKVSKNKVGRVAVSGGASQSREICRITADIFNLPLVRGRTSETSGLGAAIVTAVGLGIHPTFKSAIKEMVAYDDFFDPDPANVSLYKKLYNRVYKKIYPVLKPVYRQIQDITGYPE
ncbi:MAG: carbohydrate kinase [Desulfobacteraceae bacterium]|nr:carbohydrate kinase [Desulfobacteraceae bacterium]